MIFSSAFKFTFYVAFRKVKSTAQVPQQQIFHIKQTGGIVLNSHWMNYSICYQPTRCLSVEAAGTAQMCRLQKSQNFVKAAIAIVIVCNIANDNFCMHHGNWQLLFVLLLLITFISIIAVDMLIGIVN